MLHISKIVCAFCILLTSVTAAVASNEISQKELLGKKIFDDKNLSLNSNQACNSCHAGKVGWTGPNSNVNAHGSVYEGSIPGSFGDRKPPSSAYATQSPLFAMQGGALFVGGNFWDGRATGWKLGNPAAEQAQGPFLNPKEQALPDAATVVYKVCNSSYSNLFKNVWGKDSCDSNLTGRAYDQIGLSIAAYEGSREVNQFSSKFDTYLRNNVKLTKLEKQGRELFMGKAKCHLCHVASGKMALFTDFTFDNLGLPKNPENPATIADPAYIDPGLGGFLRNLASSNDWRMLPFVTNIQNLSSDELLQFAAANEGKHKVPTLRNVDKRPISGLVKAFGHNGFFKSLERIVHFYNTRDVLPVCMPAGQAFTDAYAEANNCWPTAENSKNVNMQELGDLKLSIEEENSIVAFMKTLTDGFNSDNDK